MVAPLICPRSGSKGGRGLLVCEGRVLSVLRSVRRRRSSLANGLCFDGRSKRDVVPIGSHRIV